ncbi:MAG: nucleoside-diphosphate sugar epimerase/dehydratase [Lutibacter sp.]|nr:nucleoside-diphosphate sugar epimerase/dehydratase [Lutibacter sp.]MDT8416164.1 nucleoside-diphosphate sugar epimerase/dehydratase [Lutibacter sp.]
MLKKIPGLIINNSVPRWIVLLIDLYIVANTFILAYFIQFNFMLSFDTSKLIFQIPIVLGAALIGFLLIGSYKGIIRHTGLKDSINVSLASFIMMGILIAVVLVNREFIIIEGFTIPISILSIHFLLNVTVLIASRYFFKSFYNSLISEVKPGKRILIYGAGDAGLLTYSVLHDDKDNNDRVLGFIDDNKSKSKKKINGLSIYYADDVNDKFIKSKMVDEIILSIQNIRPKRLLEIVDNISKLSVKMRIVPSAKSWINNNLKVQQIKSIEIDDLLGREQIELDNPLLKNEFFDKVILITGAAGSIGSEITRQLAALNCRQLVLVDQAESELYNLQQSFCQKNFSNFTAIVGDIRNRKRMELLFKQYRPAIVFHAAAYKHVPFMEENPYEAVCVNVSGTQIVTDLSVQYRVEKFIMISTDKAVNPTNVMGATKRIAEMYITCLKNNGTTKFITTRFGNVLGSNGSVIPLFKAQIKNGGPLTVTHKDITRYFMTIPEACQLVLEAGAMGKGGEIFVFDMGDSIKIYDLALNMIRLSGLKYPKDIEIEITGLRPGEKIYEELLGDGENTTPTYNEKIMIAKAKLINTKLVIQGINELVSLNQEFKFGQTVQKMKEIVPEYISNNSVYEELDAKPAEPLTRKLAI